MGDILNIKDSLQKSDNALGDIEENLKSPGSEEKYHIFRTFLLLHPNGSQDEWNAFSSDSLFSAFAQVLDALPPSIIIILCRRHFSELPFFLNFFDKSQAVQMQPKTYLPYLCHEVRYIPIQWIVNHLFKLSDVRYAYQFLMATFTDGTTMNSNQLEMVNNQNKIWQKYLIISRNSIEMTVNEAWKKMTTYRALMKQLLDFKLAISLNDFRRFDKVEFVKNQLADCPTPLRYIKLLKSSIVGFAKANSVELPPIIITTLSHRDWQIQQKISIVQDFLPDRESQQKAIATMSFKTEEELEKIREFANGSSFKYEPLPDNYIEALQNNTSSNRLSLSKCGRSCSIEFISTQNESVFGPGGGPDLFRSSMNLLKKRTATASRSLAELANGFPANPEEYVSKLKQYFNLREIAPLIALAQYGIVLSYEKFADIEIRKKTLKNLLTNQGPQNVNLFCEILQLSDDTIIEVICLDETFIPYGEFIITNIIQYITRSNCHNFVEFVDKVVDYTASNSDVSKACKNWLKWIDSVLDRIDSEQLLIVINTILAYEALSRVTVPIQQKRILYQFWKSSKDNKSFSEELTQANCGDFAEIANPHVNKNFTQSAFVGGFTSNDGISFATALYRVQRLEMQKKMECVVAAIPIVSGKFYGRILCLYEILRELKMNYSNEIAVLQILSYSTEHEIDFHELNKDPLPILLENTTINNVLDLLPLEKIFKLTGDSLLLNLMINKMNSSSYDDYKPFIARLDHKSSLEPLVKKIAQRFSTKDRIGFYQGIGCLDIKKKEQTEYDLKCYALTDYIKPEYFQNPAKLICELYSKLVLHEKFGQALHNLCASIAKRYDFQISRLCEHLLGLWLNDNAMTKTPDSPLIYTETYEEVCESDDQTNIQKALFILRSWKQRTAAKWLIRFIFQSDPITYRAKAKAVICLFAIADRNLICDAYYGNFDELVGLNSTLYYASRLELFDIHYEIEDFSPQKIKEIIKQAHKFPVGALCAVLELCIEHKINNRDILVMLVNKLQETRKRFLLRTFTKFFEVFPTLRYDKEIRNIYVLVISAPINEMISQQVKTRIRSRHLAVIRDLFDSIAAESIYVDYLIIENKQVSWAEAISRLCSSGNVTFAADLGAHLVGSKTRHEALLRLLQDDKYDEALYSGFDKDLVFSFILNNNLIGNATNMLIDEHFVIFTAWLKKYRHEDAIAKVKAALLKQGRTKEVSRMEARLAKQTV